MMRFGQGNRGMGGGFFPGGASMIFGCLMFLFVAAILITMLVLIVRIYKAVVKKTYGGKPQEKVSDISAAITILNERFAKGEVTEEDYKKIKDNILK